MSKKKRTEGLFDSVKHIGDNAEESVQESHKPHGIFDAANQMADAARNTVNEAHAPHNPFDAVSQMADAARGAVQASHPPAHGIFDAVSDMADNARTTVNQANEQSSTQVLGTSTDIPVHDATSGGSNQQGGTPYGWDSSSTTPSAVDQWVNGGDDGEFHGSGGVGSADYMKNLREAHERAGGEYNSQMYGADEIPNNKDENS